MSWLGVAARAAGTVFGGSARAAKWAFGSRYAPKPPRGIMEKPSRAESVISGIYSYDWAVQGIKRITGAMAPSYTEGVVVRISGMPGSQMRTLYRVALALAFGTTPAFGGFAGPKSLTAKYDYTARQIEVVMMYNYNGVSGNVLTSADGPRRMDPSPQPYDGKIGGPYNDYLYGGDWPGFVGTQGLGEFEPLGWSPPEGVLRNNELFGIATTPTSNATAPFKTILSYVPGFVNPAPTFDQSTRTTTDMITLATQLILSPCCQPQPATTFNRYQKVPTISTSAVVNLTAVTGEVPWTWNVGVFQAQASAAISKPPWVFLQTN